ncbi:MAG TPA: hypothetical protein VFI17_00455 [Solirubrobacterales bacterium]|nr:hypothetical protein [Solirubrobacterales bacterium]
MTRITKILVVSGLALMAFSAGAGTAQAEPPMFHIEGWPTKLTGTALNTTVLNVDGSSVECSTQSLTGEATSETSSTLTVIHLWSSCKAFGFISATVNPGSCHTLWHLTSAETAKTDIVCTKEGDAITVNAGSGICVVKIAAQPERAHVIFFNQTVGGKMEFIAKQTLESVTATVNVDGFGCPLSGTGVRNNAQMPGEWTIPGATVS